jgi:cytoskeletal protein CcmA (bactofilin family)
MFGRKPPSGESPEPPERIAPTPFQPAAQRQSPPIPARPAATGEADALPPRPVPPPQQAAATPQPPRRPAEPIRPEPVREVRKLIVGREITLSGEISACDHLIVEGTVEASVKDCHRLEIAESGLFRGTVEIHEAEIAGRFEGQVTVQGRLAVRASGKVEGTIQYGELAVEAGGTLDGQIHGHGKAPAPKPAKPVPAPPDAPLLNHLGAPSTAAEEPKP